ncbi:hypothetical protein [Haloactinopolyspora sp.]|uniref:hypothetical protein n=1 Tax=Haloactinopolyspora sp. TaxID=1966353 RepID=UPI00261F7250|nr:hypothetical protein [Haloactinopolyspora sp.]
MTEISRIDENAGSTHRFTGATRREFLRRTGWTSLAVGAVVAGLGAPAHAAGGVDYLARRTFDDWDHEFHTAGGSGQPGEPNDDATATGSGALSWGQSYVLSGLIRMYEAYRDPYYLDRFVENADLVLSVRDSERGVTNYLGESLPAWRANHPYTVGAVELTDAQGRATLEVRMGRVYCDSGTVTVRPAGSPGTFNLHVVHEQSGSQQTFSDLSMDPASPNYVVRRLYDAYPGAVLVTARDLRTSPDEAGDPLEGQYAMSSLPGIFAVHTGMITYPMASFVRIVRASPTLRANPRYRAKAEEYLTAVRAAVAVHDREWRENDLGEGYYVWLKGSPQQWDGCEQPINQTLGLGQTIAELAIATGDQTYRHRAEAMARMFSGQLTADAGGAYLWHYWPTFGHLYRGYEKTGSPETDVSAYNPNMLSRATQYEDISHAAISVDFAVLAFRGHLGFTGQHMARLARTFTQNVATTSEGAATAWTRVDGTGGPSANYAHQAPRWAPIAWWDSEVHRHALAIYDHYLPTPEKIGTERNGFGWLLGNIAHLQHYAQRRD